MRQTGRDEVNDEAQLFCMSHDIHKKRGINNSAGLGVAICTCLAVLPHGLPALLLERSLIS